MKNAFRQLWQKIRNLPSAVKEFFKESGRETYASMCFMGVGQMINGQYIKGLLYMLAEGRTYCLLCVTGHKRHNRIFHPRYSQGGCLVGHRGRQLRNNVADGYFAWFALGVLVYLYYTTLKTPKSMPI